ncbi:MAG: LON peptidase substrate-binding domain-containing protein [Candidatus Dormibacteraeota bacterium]|nr:LON peptidase substrate-binding domain-containing protein [Candidatus Dormibacteraeota bacterium]
MAVEIALFPLNAVLFPHMPMALHIFEERYREMMRDCNDSGMTFGIVAIREGLEVGAGAVPHEVGTLAQLRDVEELDDGRYNLVVVGASRFHIDSIRLRRPYLTGEVAYLEDSPATAASEALARRVVAQFREYILRLRALSQDDSIDLDLPDEPELLSYLVSAALQVSTAERQRLLEIGGADERLRACASLLRRELALLDHMLGRSAAPSPTVPLN